MEKKKKKNYLSNKHLIPLIVECREKWLAAKDLDPDANPIDYLTPELVEKVMLLVDRMASRSNFRNYTFTPDMQAEAYLTLMLGCLKFDPERSQNAFAYWSQIVMNCFRNYLTKEKKHRDIRDNLLIEKGMEPSWTKQLEHEEAQRERRERISKK